VEERLALPPAPELPEHQADAHEDHEILFAGHEEALAGEPDLVRAPFRTLSAFPVTPSRMNTTPARRIRIPQPSTSYSPSETEALPSSRKCTAWSMNRAKPSATSAGITGLTFGLKGSLAAFEAAWALESAVGVSVPVVPPVEPTVGGIVRGPEELTAL
jgi:hypothetical protein